MSFLQCKDVFLPIISADQHNSLISNYLLWANNILFGELFIYLIPPSPCTLQMQWNIKGRETKTFLLLHSRWLRGEGGVIVLLVKELWVGCPPMESRRLRNTTMQIFLLNFSNFTIWFVKRRNSEWKRRLSIRKLANIITKVERRVGVN